MLQCHEECVKHNADGDREVQKGIHDHDIDLVFKF